MYWITAKMILSSGQPFCGRTKKTKPEKEKSKRGSYRKTSECSSEAFQTISYTEAIEILLNSKENKKENLFTLLKNGEQTFSLSMKDILLKNTLKAR